VYSPLDVPLDPLLAERIVLLARGKEERSDPENVSAMSARNGPVNTVR